MELPRTAEGERRPFVPALSPPSKERERILPLRSPNLTGSAPCQDTIQLYAEDPSTVTLEVIMIGSPTGHTIWNRTVKFGENMVTINEV